MNIAGKCLKCKEIVTASAYYIIFRYYLLNSIFFIYSSLLLFLCAMNLIY